MSSDNLRRPDQMLRGLRHTRRFRDQPVPLAVIDEIVAAGQSIGDVRLLVVDDLVTREELSTVGSFSSTMAGAAVVLVVVRATTSDMVDDKSLGGRVADAMMLVANRHGLGSGYGWFSGQEDQLAVREILAIAGSEHVLMAIGVGYIDDDPRPSDSSLARIQTTLSGLSGNRNRPPSDE